MHKGSIYPTNPLLRTLAGNYSWPSWFPLAAYEGTVSTLQSPDWSAAVGDFGPTWTLVPYTPGDTVVVYRAPAIVLDGRTITCEYWFGLNGTGTLVTGELDIFVDAVQQTRNPSTNFPPHSKAPSGYSDSFQVVAPANPRKVWREAVDIVAQPY